jgi:hypothetical protein
MKNSKNKNTKKIQKQVDEIEFKDQMADLDSWLLVLSNLCILIDIRHSLQGEIISEIGGILFQYLEAKSKLETKLFAHYKNLQTPT